jgi:hypothetical protein
LAAIASERYNHLEQVKNYVKDHYKVCGIETATGMMIGGAIGGLGGAIAGTLNGLAVCATGHDWPELNQKTIDDKIDSTMFSIKCFQIEAAQPQRLPRFAEDPGRQTPRRGQ